MKIQIDVDGNLKIERAGRLKYQLCPFAPVPTTHCGDWCPHFDEPEPYTASDGTQGHGISLCHGKEVYGLFEDLRVKRDGA